MVECSVWGGKVVGSNPITPTDSNPMKMINILNDMEIFKMDLEKFEVLDMISECKTKGDFYEMLGYSRNPNSRMRKEVVNFLYSLDVDLDYEFKMKIYEIRICPVCNKEFSERKIESKITCSYACSNTYFRSGVNNGSHQKALLAGNEDSARTYRTICVDNHEKSCVVCNESNIVAVHHYDENHHNNDPANLVPMCPTHHNYMHSKFKYLIEEQVHQYVLNWKLNNET